MAAEEYRRTEWGRQSKGREKGMEEREWPKSWVEPRKSRGQPGVSGKGSPPPT